MRIKSIAAKNYRTLENINFPFIGSYCTISGRNNAGKSCLIRLLHVLFRKGGIRPWLRDRYSFVYADDRTQWHNENDPIEVTYVLELSHTDDPALLTFIEKFIGKSIEKEPTIITLRYLTDTKDVTTFETFVNDIPTDTQTSKEIAVKISEADLMFLYNSTMRHEEIYYGGRGRQRFMYEVILSEDERRQLNEAAKETEKKLKRLAKQNREELNSILGRLSERYDVEFSPLDGYATHHMPFGINLKDKTVEVPLNDWGSGTQNRTHILMEVLQANRIKTTESQQSKITPIVVIEEPESFLHPSAQAEFGTVLRTLATDLGIQIIVTTHSPYMLNQEDSTSNLLLCREIKRGKQLQTELVDTSGENWMAPFAEHLGLDSNEFSSWQPLFSSHESKVLLVEGVIDQQYFEYLQHSNIGIEGLRRDIEVVPYGGKDTLKNIMLVQFVLGKFDNVFITYDLDCEQEVSGALSRLSLMKKTDHLPLGVNQSGKNAIEGLLPSSVLSAVNGQETDLVMQLGSQVSVERRKAKEELKKKYLAEFKKHSNFPKEELKHLKIVIEHINKRFSKPEKRVHRTCC
ncbi:hypothetical protein SDC9_86751 [bioreactor metagenome]|uniref:Endonuclease GajA/Old nuclease/RecF-like AAA domain-containing protein n=1 Tax=bioreactor metagenome TaxID=1076179 RepID=A0A644ZN44_9ZZZZ|nr:AAA family ATPase [Aminivibrio sp.]MEA4949792.1 AAA family ATPase [Petrimonas sp.]MEA4952571.1 AAA family ATPase [Aminivibrio sp.]